MVINSLEDFFDVLAERVADRIAARDPALIDQHDRRGLIGRRHIDAVRRRMAAKTGDAFCKGRDYLLTPAAVRDELEKLSRLALAERPEPPVERRKASRGKTVKPSTRDEMARLKRELETDMRKAREKNQ